MPPPEIKYKLIKCACKKKMLFVMRPVNIRLIRLIREKLGVSEKFKCSAIDKPQITAALAFCCMRKVVKNGDGMCSRHK